VLENKDIRDDNLPGIGDAEEKRTLDITDPSLAPGYRGEEKPTTTDPPKGTTDFSIEAILADIRKKTSVYSQDSDTGTRGLETGKSASTEKLGPDPIKPKNVPPANEADADRTAMQEMTAAMRELTAELRTFRAQMTHTGEAPPGSLSESPPADNTPTEYFSGFVLEKPGTSQTDDKPSIRGEPDGKQDEEKDMKKSNKALSIISNILFYVVIVAMVLGAFLMRSTSKGQPFMIAGISAANVLTSSMEDVYPRGSLIITKQVDPKELKVGDDITFMVSEDTSFTHRIIGIIENYQGTGQRAFETKGTMNAKPDEEKVAAANVVGKVIFHSKAIGDFANFVRKNWPILIFILVVIIALISFLKWNAKKSDGDDDGDKQPEEKPKRQKPRSHTKKRSVKFKRSERDTESYE